jgi:hypothetical protein
MKRSILLLTLSFAALMSYPQDRQLVRSQDSPGQISCLGLTTNGVDDFMFTDDTDLKSARWFFGYSDGSYAPFSSWDIIIYENNNGVPGKMIRHYAIPFEQRHEAYKSTSPYGGTTYEYWADLAPAFQADANTTYWISVRASGHVINGQWRWDLINPVGC